LFLSAVEKEKETQQSPLFTGVFAPAMTAWFIAVY
jgi:hypothetical protein